MPPSREKKARRKNMRNKFLITVVCAALLVLVASTSARAQLIEPLFLGAMGSALGFAIGGTAAGAAIGGAAGLAAGLLVTAPYYRGSACAYGPVPYGSVGVWVPPPYPRGYRYGYSGYRHQRHHAWRHDYNRYGGRPYRHWR